MPIPTSPYSSDYNAATSHPTGADGYVEGLQRIIEEFTAEATRAGLTLRAFAQGLLYGRNNFLRTRARVILKWIDMAPTEEGW